MALINCPECGAQVSDKAVSCPKCGHPVNAASDYGNSLTQEPEPAVQPKEKGIMQYLNIGWMGIAIIIIIVALFALLGTCNWAPV